LIKLSFLESVISKTNNWQIRIRSNCRKL